MGNETESLAQYEAFFGETNHPLKRPLNITLLAILFGVIIGTFIACFGIHNVNFVLFSALIVGFIYAQKFNQIITRKIRLSSAFYYFIFSFCIAAFFRRMSFGEINQTSPEMILTALAVLIFESILFSLLLYAGSAIYCICENKKILSH